MSVLAPTREVGRSLASWDPSAAEPMLALRAGIGVTAVLVTGAFLGYPDWLIAAVLGAWTAGTTTLTTERPHPFLPLLAGSGFATALLLGGLAAPHPVLILLVTAVWALAMAMIGTLGQAFGPVSTVCGVGLVLAPYITAHAGILAAAAAAAGGAVIQALATQLPPRQRFAGDRRILATAYRALATDALALADAMNTPLSTDDLIHASSHLTGRRKLPESLRQSVTALYELRAAIIAVAAARARLLDDDRTAARRTAAVLRHAGEALEQLADDTEHRRPIREGWEERLASAVDAAPDDDTDIGRSRLTIAGQEVQRLYRAMYHLARITERVIDDEPATSVVPRRVRVRSRAAEDLATLRSQMTLRSPAMQHALRSAALIVIATQVGLLWPGAHGHWIALVSWIVLKPDFATTVGHGVVRILGTAVGAFCATALAIVAPPQSLWAVATVVGFAFLGYFMLPVSYMVFSAAVSGLAVIQIDLVGDSAWDAGIERVVATLVGGVLALGLYALWPTWETRRLPDRLADLVDAYRAYAELVLDMQARPGERNTARLQAGIDEIRLRSADLAAGIQKAAAEPVAGPQPHSEDARDVEAALSRAARALVVLEGAVREADAAQLPGVDEFAETVSRKYSALSQRIRGGQPPAVDLSAALADLDVELDSGTMATARRRRLLDWESDIIVSALEDATVLVRDWNRDDD